MSQAYLARSGGDREEEGLALAADLQAPGGLKDERLRAYIDTAAPFVIQTASSALARLPDSAEAHVYLLRTTAKRPDAPRNMGFQSALAQPLAMRGHVAEAWKVAVASKSYTAAELAILGLVSADSVRVSVSPWIRSRGESSISAIVGMAITHDTATLKSTAAALEKFIPTIKPDAPLMHLRSEQ